jgi:hypothetical protein
MSAILQQFLTAHLPFPGLVGWGVFLEGRSVCQQSHAGWLSSDRIEQVVTGVIEFVESRGILESKPGRLVWTFENLLFHLACRADGAWLVLLVDNRGQAPSGALLSAVDEFLRMSVD